MKTNPPSTPDAAEDLELVLMLMDRNIRHTVKAVERLATKTATLAARLDALAPEKPATSAISSEAMLRPLEKLALYNTPEGDRVRRLLTMGSADQ
jgi:hypothetical protein